MGRLSGRRRAIGRFAVAVACVLAPLVGARAQPPADAPPEVEPSAHLEARDAFEAGLRAANEQRWNDAVAHFRRSLGHVERPAARFNLLVALEHVGDHEALIVVADRFLSLTTDARYRAQRATARSLRAAAVDALATPRHDSVGSAETDTTQSPRDHHPSRVARDAEEAPLAGAREAGDDVGDVDDHHHHASGATSHDVGGGARDDGSPEVGRGATDASPEVARSAIDDRHASGAASRELARDAHHDDGVSPAASRELGLGTSDGRDPRRKLGLASLSVGLASAVAGWALVTASAVLARRLSDADATQAGFLSDAMRYRRVRAATHHLALTSAIALGASLLLRARPSRQHAIRWALGLLGASLTVTGATLLALRPRSLAETTLTGPSRALGSLLLAAGLPLVLAPLVFVSSDAESASSSVGLGLTVALR